MREFKIKNGNYIKDKNNTSTMMYTILIILSFFILFSTYKNGIYPVIKGYGNLYLIFKPLIFAIVSSVVGIITEYLCYLILNFLYLQLPCMSTFFGWQLYVSY